MKIHALALIAAFALPTHAIADGKTPPANSPDKPTEKTTDKPAGKPNDKPARLGDSDVAIVSHLHHVNQMEIDLGKAALKSGTKAVKSYSETLVNDHQRVDKDLTSLVRKRGLPAIPAETPRTEADQEEQKAMMEQVAHLKTLKGAEFDRTFLIMMTTGHDKEIARIGASIDTAQDPDLRTMLTSIQPVLQRHAEDARGLQKSPQASLDQLSDQPIDPPIQQLPSSRPRSRPR